MLRKIPANVIYGCAVIFFGLATVLISQSGGYAGLMVLRALLGVGEAVITTGFVYLTLFYKREELALRSGRTLAHQDMMPLLTATRYLFCVLCSGWTFQRACGLGCCKESRRQAWFSFLAVAVHGHGDPDHWSRHP